MRRTAIADFVFAPATLSLTKMKILALILLLIPAMCLAANDDYPEFAQLKAREAKLKATLAEIRSLYSDNQKFLAALNTAQKKWDEYCSAMLEARFPGEDKRVEYGSVYDLVATMIRTGMINERIKELSLWTEGTEEGDVSAGSVKWKKDLAKIRKSRKAKEHGAEKGGTDRGSVSFPTRLLRPA
jgi:hypothetical protein